MGEASMWKWLKRARREINPYQITVRPSGQDLAERAVLDEIRPTALHLRLRERKRRKFCQALEARFRSGNNPVWFGYGDDGVMFG